MKQVGLVLLMLAGEAFANGRPSGVSSIQFEQTAEQNIVAGLTFGLVISHDGGASWQWMCEKAIGYGGMYDPVYAYSRSGAIFATTFTGMKVARDACSFDAAATGSVFVSTDQLDPDGNLYAGIADPAANSIAKSTDDGATFSAMSMPGEPGDWWESLEIAPANHQRLYLTGYRFQQLPSCASKRIEETGDQQTTCGGTKKNFLLFTSDDGGATWTPFHQGLMETSESSAIQIAGISKSDPDVLYARVTYETGIVGDALYRSSNAGYTWTRIFAQGTSIAFVVRKNGELVAGTPQRGVFVSEDLGDTWTATTGGPHPNCLVENSVGEVWACTQASTEPGIPIADGFGIMKTRDLATWTPVLKFTDIAAPVACPTGTVQKDVCEPTWCGMAKQMGFTSTAIDCSSPVPIPPLPDAQSGPAPKISAGCCDTGGDQRGAIVLVLLVGLPLSRARAPRPRGADRARPR